MDTSDENDLFYGDLKDLESKAEITSLKKELESERQKNLNLVKERAELINQIEILIKEKQQVEINMATLYKTALVEIERKNKLLQEKK